jgi:tRNA threonylcarbamoyladenosine biosynthesis protein TsaE
VRSLVVESFGETAARLSSATALEVVSTSPEETATIGSILARWLEDGDVVLLHGDLGAGKTTLAKGIAAALGVEAVVSSPSFALINEYDSGVPGPVSRLYHLDLYRLRDDAELDSIGFAEYVAPDDGVALVEWPERAVTLLPARYVLVELESAGADHRMIRITPFPTDGSWSGRLADLRARFAGEGG